MSQPTELEMLSDTCPETRVDMDKVQKGCRTFIRAAHATAQNRGLRTGFFSQGDRPTPSLPKLKFLEGKD